MAVAHVHGAGLVCRQLRSHAFQAAQRRNRNDFTVGMGQLVSSEDVAEKVGL